MNLFCHEPSNSNSLLKKLSLAITCLQMILPHHRLLHKEQAVNLLAYILQIEFKWIAEPN